MKKTVIAASIAVLASAPIATFAAQPDWSKVEATEITLFYPGVSPMEWILGDIRVDRARHGGGRAFKQGDTCADCHADEVRQMGETIVSGEKLEPNPVAGKPAAIPVSVQAAHDGDSLFLRFSWTQPAAASAKGADDANPVKLAVMFDAGKVEMADQSGCWASCHADSRTMPDGSDGKTKYVKDGSLSGGVFYDLIQWRSGENKAIDGHVAEERVMEGGSALVGAEGKLDGDTWTVVFERKLTGGTAGDIALEAGKSYNFGFAIHNEHAAGRYHHVSLGYKLGIDADGDVVAKKQ